MKIIFNFTVTNHSRGSRGLEISANSARFVIRGVDAMLKLNIKISFSGIK